MNRLAVCCASLGLISLLFSCTPASPTSNDASSGDDVGAQLVARAGDLTVTTAELDAWIKEKLFEAKAGSASRLYELRSRYVTELLTERLLAAEAETRGTTPEQVIQDELAVLGPVTDQEVEDFFADYQDRMHEASLDDVGDQIRRLLEARRESDAIEAFRDRSNIVMVMKAPRILIEADGPSKGPDAAKVTIVEFSDFQCRFCRRVIPTMQAVLERYPDDVRLVYRHLPLRSHSRARPAAVASVCAQQQDEFWSYHDSLFANTKALADEDLRRYAEELELDMALFDACVADSRAADKVRKDVEDAVEAGIQSTPAFVVNGILISGAQPAENFFEIIDAEIARADDSTGDKPPGT
ncbi:MAG: DsbA family protein [Myxococcales bacterium]|nr:DsbA family protein [Myxococcales bacterium]